MISRRNPDVPTFQRFGPTFQRFASTFQRFNVPTFQRSNVLGRFASTFQRFASTFRRFEPNVSTFWGVLVNVSTFQRSNVSTFQRFASFCLILPHFASLFASSEAKWGKIFDFTSKSEHTSSPITLDAGTEAQTLSFKTPTWNQNCTLKRQPRAFNLKLGTSTLNPKP